MRFSNRILIVDDNPEIHSDFRKILQPLEPQSNAVALEALERDLFEQAEKAPKASTQIEYRLDSAHQGQEAVDMVVKAVADEDPYAVIFMDVRMPPGINGVEAMARIWEHYPLVEMVIVTAYSDYSWEDILGRVGVTDKLMFLRKPFDHVSVKQMALSLSRKFSLNQHHFAQVEKIENALKDRHGQLSQMLSELKCMRG